MKEGAMDDLKFTARKTVTFIPISDEVLFPSTPRKATFAWPSFVCGYEFSEDYYTEGHACELPVGHEGPHRAELEWETRPADVCKGEGHIWGEWESVQTYGHAWQLVTEWTIQPEAWRRCERCGTHDFKDGERNTAFSDAMVRALLP